jgi:hypothetical protein
VKASRVGALCLVAGSLAGLTGGRVLAQSPVELRKEIADLKATRAKLSDPNTMVSLLPTMTPSAGEAYFQTSDRVSWERRAAAHLKPEDRAGMAREYGRMKRIALDLTDEMLRDKEALLAQLAANPNAKSWLTYVGTVEGSTSNVVCHDSGPQAARKVAFTFSGDGALSVSGPGQPKTVGQIRSDGTMIARGAGAASSWWGRFRWGSDGTISGRGETGSQSGIERCDGNWSVP